MGFLLHHSVSESAERAPDRHAFRFEGEALTYAQLESRSNRIARALLDRGLEPNDRVGLYLNKCLELPAALYGILKAGGAYVPIDPTAPASRIDFILKDCGIHHLVSQPTKRRQLDRLASDNPQLESVFGAVSAGEADGRFLSWQEVDSYDDQSPQADGTELDLAYVMYTSGSTGSPKGLMHTHRSGRSYAELSAAVYGVDPEDRLGNHSPLHFDMSTFEYLTAPLCGATTVIIPEEATMFPVELAELIERERMTFWYSVPLALIQLLQHGEIEQRDHSALRWVLFGGEPFPPKHLWRLMELWPQVRFSNSYGPAEVNQCTYFHVPPERKGAPEAIPIGTVWPGADGLVVDEHDQPVEDGKAGELLIRAPTMMQGYWGRPDLNQEAFFTRQPFPDFDQRYYRTGDLVRTDPQGQFEFLGRKDRQIKIRGYRVELDEVENVVAGLEGVTEAAAVAVRNADDQYEIFAVVLLADGMENAAETLRLNASEYLPSYAVPSRVELRERLPRTGTGKIDRRRLAAELAHDAE